LHMYTKCINLSVYPSPSHWYPFLDRTCFTFLSFILIVQGGFALIFHTCIYCTLISLTLSVIYCPAHLVFNSFQCILLCSVSILFILYHSLFLSSLPITL
jgi:hypothetical protein